MESRHLDQRSYLRNSFRALFALLGGLDLMIMTRRKWSKVSIAQASFVMIHDMVLENIVVQFKGYT